MRTTAILMLLMLTACQKEPIKITIKPEPRKEAKGPHLTTDTDGPCTALQIEGLETKSDTPLITIRHRGRTDSITGQKSADGTIYISFCLENNRWLRRKWKRRRTTITAHDEDGTKTTIKRQER
jgi:hypothetical protein